MILEVDDLPGFQNHYGGDVNTSELLLGNQHLLATAGVWHLENPEVFKVASLN